MGKHQSPSAGKCCLHSAVRFLVLLERGRDTVSFALPKANSHTRIYLKSHTEFAAASACWKAAGDISHTSALRLLNIERTNRDQVEFI